MGAGRKEREGMMRERGEEMRRKRGEGKGERYLQSE